MNRRALLTALVAFAATPALAAQDRYWVIPKEAIARLQLTPLSATKQSRPVLALPGEDGQDYSQDDVLRGLLTYIFRSGK